MWLYAFNPLLSLSILKKGDVEALLNFQSSSEFKLESKYLSLDILYSFNPLLSLRGISYGIVETYVPIFQSSSEFKLTWMAQF